MVRYSPTVRRNLVYAVFLGFVAFGMVLDHVFWQGNPPYITWNDVIQKCGMIIFTVIWQIEDSRAFGFTRSRKGNIWTVLFTPLGLAFYLRRTRKWPAALAIWLGYWGGALLAALAVHLIARSL